MSALLSQSRTGRRDALFVALKVSAFSLAAVLVIMMALALWILFFRAPDRAKPGKSIQIEVRAGSSTAQIARELSDAGVIGNANAFRIRARLTGADGQMKVGVYDLTTGLSDKDVIAKLEAGPSVEYISVTIPEGFVLTQIAKRLDAETGIPQAEFLRLARTGAREFVDSHPYLIYAYKGSLEGYLFPKTYRIQAGSSARDVIEMMLGQFDTEMNRIDVASYTASGLTLNQLVVIASMIERESKLDAERPLVSSVIRNRLARNMLLEIDATIEYVLPGNRFRLTNRDIRINSPYNTYRRPGLPPGPISNPGLASLKAAASPADTNFLYYVLTGKDGSHTFAENKADFLLAKQKSKEVFGR